MRTWVIVPGLALGLVLAGCGEKAKPDAAATADSAGATWDDGKPAPAASSDAKDKFALSLPGFDLKMDLPNAMLAKSDFELDGVKLYPGSTINAMAVAKPERGVDAQVDIGFAAPADPAAVRAYFVKELGDRIEDPGAARLSGRTSDGDIFTIDLTPAAGGTAGKLRIIG